MDANLKGYFKRFMENGIKRNLLFFAKRILMLYFRACYLQANATNDCCSTNTAELKCKPTLSSKDLASQLVTVGDCQQLA